MLGHQAACSQLAGRLQANLRADSIQILQQKKLKFYASGWCRSFDFFFSII
jgi:hypothetical protein